MEPGQAEQLCVEAVGIITNENSTPEDNRKAVGLFRQVAEAGFSQGMFGLAEMMMAGKGTEKDVHGAIQLYEDAGKMGNLPALFRLGNIYWEPGDNNNPRRSYECFMECCDAGFPPAYNCMGDCLYYGIGVEADVGKAMVWYRKSSEEGDPAGTFKLACLYNGEMGIQKDEAQANRLFMQAAAAGVPEAQLQVGSLIFDGRMEGGKQEAAKWFERCAEAIPIAKFNLATMYYSGDGVGRDLAKAFAMFHDLAHAGDSDAMFQVGKMLINGEGVGADPEEGFRHIGEAARAGNQEAMLLVESLRRRQNTQMIHIDGAE